MSEQQTPLQSDSIWGPEQQGKIKPAKTTRTSTTEGKPKKFKQVTDVDIVNDPDKNQNNPVRQVDGEILNNIWLRNMGYKQGSIETTNVPVGGNIRFLTKPSYDPEYGVDNWYIQGSDATGASVGIGTISTWNRKGARITTKEGRRLTVFRPNLIVRR